MDSIIGCIIGIILYHIFIKPIEVRKNRQYCIDHGLVPSDTPVNEVNHDNHQRKICDNCMHYCWHYDWCDKFEREVDGREVHDCCEEM